MRIYRILWWRHVFTYDILFIYTLYLEPVRPYARNLQLLRPMPPRRSHWEKTLIGDRDGEGGSLMIFVFWGEHLDINDLSQSDFESFKKLEDLFWPMSCPWLVEKILPEAHWKWFGSWMTLLHDVKLCPLIAEDKQLRHKRGRFVHDNRLWRVWFHSFAFPSCHHLQVVWPSTNQVFSAGKRRQTSRLECFLTKIVCQII